MLVSVIDGAVQSAVQSSRSSGTVIYNPSASQDVMTEVLRNTVNIPPTIVKHQGDRISVLVALSLIHIFSRAGAMAKYSAKRVLPGMFRY